jgi:RimJ/RimL family protein N-acetyltransferase
MDLLMRDVTFQDSYDIYELRNEPEVRKYSRNEDLISQESHSIWLIERLKQIPDQPFWAFENHLGKVGFTRFDLNSTLKHFEISITINLNLRGRGFGKLILNQSIESCTAQNPSANFYAETHIDNLASTLLFQNCGFQKSEIKGNFLVLRRTASVN